MERQRARPGHYVRAARLTGIPDPLEHRDLHCPCWFGSILRVLIRTSSQVRVTSVPAAAGEHARSGRLHNARLTVMFPICVRAHSFAAAPRIDKHPKRVGPG
jgi:hypothetical protein